MKLAFLKGSKIGSSITLNAGNCYRVGRDATCEIKVPEGDVSAVHLRLLVESPSSLVLENVTTHRKTTFVNGAPVDLGAKIRLSPGDEIALGFSRSVAFTLKNENLRGDMTHLLDQVSSASASLASETGYLGDSSEAPTHYQGDLAASIAAVLSEGSGAVSSPGFGSESSHPESRDQVSIAGAGNEASVDPLSVADDVVSVAVPKVAGRHHPKSGGQASKWVLSVLFLFLSLASVALFAGVFPSFVAHRTRAAGLLWHPCDDETAPKNVRMCFADPDPSEWRKGAIWLESAAMNGKGASMMDKIEVRRKLLSLAACSVEDETARKSVQATLSELGRYRSLQKSAISGKTRKGYW